MCPAHAAGLIGVREAAFDPLPSATQESLATRAADAATVGVDGLACRCLIGPRLRPAGGLTDVGPKAVRGELEHDGATVAPFVGDDLVRQGHGLAVGVGHVLKLLDG